MGLRAKEEKEKEETNLGEISRFRTFLGSGEGVGMFKKETALQNLAGAFCFVGPYYVQ